MEAPIVRPRCMKCFGPAEESRASVVLGTRMFECLVCGFIWLTAAELVLPINPVHRSE
jgi:hypothetical protein